MQHLILLLKRKVPLAILGTVLFGGLGVFIATFPFSSVFQSAPYQSAGEQAQAGLAPVGAAASSTTTPSATPQEGGKLTALRGTVSSTDPGASSFIVRQNNGSTTTVVVTSKTTFHGDVRSLRGLQTGWQVAVTGSFQANGTFTASTVDADNGR